MGEDLLGVLSCGTYDLRQLQVLILIWKTATNFFQDSGLGLWAGESIHRHAKQTVEVCCQFTACLPTKHKSGKYSSSIVFSTKNISDWPQSFLGTISALDTMYYLKKSLWLWAGDLNSWSLQKELAELETAVAVPQAHVQYFKRPNRNHTFTHNMMAQAKTHLLWTRTMSTQCAVAMVRAQGGEALVGSWLCPLWIKL